ncbi:MAG TPA: cytochrome c [Pseudomonadota bacterium]|nr:cytochrome c [Pseudomonadota bacterium]
MPLPSRLFLSAVLLGLGCQSPEPTSTLLNEVPLAVHSVSWNAKNVATGKISAVAELNEDTVVFSDQGALVFTAGLLLNTDATSKSWNAASVIPAGDLAGQWLVGVDGKGHLRRLRDRAVLEDVSDRYGLRSDVISDLAAADVATATVFALENELAVADGKNVVRYPVKLRNLQGGGGRVVGISDGTAIAFEPSSGKLKRFGLPQAAVAMVIDTAGRVVIATKDTLYREQSRELGSALDVLYVSADAPLLGLALASGEVWVQVGDALALLASDEIQKSPPLALPADAKLFGSPTGDVWVLSSGMLRRFGEDSGGGADEEVWRQTVQPVFTRLCALCHMPGGSANLDLSTYKSWDIRRAAIKQRVIDGKPTPMPPKGAGTPTQDELMAISAWLQPKMKP